MSQSEAGEKSGLNFLAKISAWATDLCIKMCNNVLFYFMYVQIVLEGLESTFTQRLLHIMDKFLHSKDKFRRCRGMLTTYLMSFLRVSPHHTAQIFIKRTPLLRPNLCCRITSHRCETNYVASKNNLINSMRRTRNRISFPKHLYTLTHTHSQIHTFPSSIELFIFLVFSNVGTGKVGIERNQQIHSNRYTERRNLQNTRWDTVPSWYCCE